MGAAGTHQGGPRRRAFAAALALGLAAVLGMVLAGAQPAHSGHPPPNTKWVNPSGSPKWKGKPKGKIRARRPIFRFRSTINPQKSQRFVCRRDNLRWTPCRPPVQPKRKLSYGKHQFRVYAVNRGRKDPTPARTYFTVVPRG